jgi:AhpD family alkylhydroperoxidase
MQQRLSHFKLSPQAAAALGAFSKAVADLPVDSKIRELVKIRASQMNGCLFCTDMHVKEARLQGERELRLYHLTSWRESSLFAEKEKAALEWTELLTRPNSHGITDAQYEQMLRHFDETELSNLTYVITNINAWNRLGVAFRPEAGSLDKTFGLDKLELS